MGSSSDGKTFLENMSPSELALVKDIAEVAAENAAAKALIAVGIDIRNPIQSQQMFGALRTLAIRAADPDVEKDWAWTRRTRERSEGIVGKVILTSFSVGVLGGLHALWAGIKSLITPHP